MEHAASVDIVITWVDGSDPHWRRKKSQYRPDRRHSLLTADVEGRYRCNEELRFLLRSIDRYWRMPGRIFLVTDQQVPSFIRSHPRLVVVDHREFMAPDVLPVFSSIAIEANLHRIRDLSEYYVVFNDDQFLTRQVCFDDFFWKHGAVIYLSDESLPTYASNQNHAGHDGGIHARDWIASRYGTSYVDHVIEHYPKGIRKSWMVELEAEDRAMFIAASRARFREVGTPSIMANVYGHWCLANGKGEIRRNACVYLESTDIEYDRELDALAPLVNGKLCLCINDTTDNREDVGELHTRTSRLLNALLPTPSNYERTDCTSCLNTPMTGQKCHIHKTENPGLHRWTGQSDFLEREQRRA
ncbi:MAG: Stealth CR1 domain-containing protein [Burkholderiaceae bacterium]